MSRILKNIQIQILTILSSFCAFGNICLFLLVLIIFVIAWFSVSCPFLSKYVTGRATRFQKLEKSERWIMKPFCFRIKRTCVVVSYMSLLFNLKQIGVLWFAADHGTTSEESIGRDRILRNIIKTELTLCTSHFIALTNKRGPKTRPERAFVGLNKTKIPNSVNTYKWIVIDIGTTHWS